METTVSWVSGAGCSASGSVCVCVCGGGGGVFLAESVEGDVFL